MYMDAHKYFRTVKIIFYLYNILIIIFDIYYLYSFYHNAKIMNVHTWLYKPIKFMLNLLYPVNKNTNGNFKN